MPLDIYIIRIFKEWIFGAETYITMLFTFVTAKLWSWDSCRLQKLLATAKQLIRASRGDVYLTEHRIP